MTLLPRHLLPSEQFGAWKERHIHVPRRAKALVLKNKAVSNPETEAYLKTHFCSRPFETLETVDEGLVHLCCPDWLPTPVGSIDDLSGAWRSGSAQNIRSSIIDGSFRYCSLLHCPLISGRSLMARDSIEAQSLIERFTGGKKADLPPPQELTLSHDRSCNLSCPSCRTKILVATKPKQQKLDEQVEASFLPTLRQAKRVYITGSGDPFGSAHFRRLIKRLKREEFPSLTFHLHSNGQLWDQRAWQDLDLAGRVEIAHISIDAAEADTYAIVRRSGSFERLLKNLAFIKSLREAGEIEYLTLSMVVQRLNFREMPAFVRLGKAYAADSISFQMIRNWGTYSDDEFKEQFLGPNHPEFDALVQILKDPELAQPGVEIGNITAHVRLKNVTAGPQ